MKYVALLRGINAGKMRRVSMKDLADLFQSLGCADVVTYINSGNVIFESGEKKDLLRKKVESALERRFGFAIPTLIKTEKEMQKIAKGIPVGWQNDSKQRTDVAYLFPEIDSKTVVKELPMKPEYVDVRYVKGALIWHIDRKNYSKSRLNYLVGHKYYQLMTIRNVNTARFLAGK